MRSVTLGAIATHAIYVSKRNHTSQRFTSLPNEIQLMGKYLSFCKRCNQNNCTI